MPHSRSLRHAVLTATLDQLASHGIDGLTVGEVTTRAGVAETTIYRRWGTRTALVADAVTELAVVHNPVPDTGTLRGELPEDTPPREFIETLSAPLYFRLLVVDEPLDRDFITRCVEQTIAIYSSGITR